MCAVYVCINDNRKELMATKKAQAPKKAPGKKPDNKVERKLRKDIPTFADVTEEIIKNYGASVETTNGILRAILCELVLARLSKK